MPPAITANQALGPKATHVETNVLFKNLIEFGAVFARSCALRCNNTGAAMPVCFYGPQMICGLLNCGRSSTLRELDTDGPSCFEKTIRQCLVEIRLLHCVQVAKRPCSSMHGLVTNKSLLRSQYNIDTTILLSSFFSIVTCDGFIRTVSGC